MCVQVGKNEGNTVTDLLCFGIFVVIKCVFIFIFYYF